MNRLYSAILLVFIFVSQVFCQEVRGTVTVAFGKVRSANGKWISVKGMKIPVTVTKVRAHRGPFSKRHRISPNIVPVVQTVYLNDHGESSYFYTPESPSELDDVVLSSAGAGAAWTYLTLGYHCGTTDTILYRWRIWDRLLSGTPQGVNAFGTELADFGVYFDLDWPEAGGPLPPSGEGEGYKITFDITVLPPIVPDGSCYFASQIREPHLSGFPPEEDGEGAFVTDFSPVFSGGGVQVGSSDDSYWHDGDLDGLYDSTESDYFGGPPSDANFLLQVEVAGTVTEHFPTTYTMEQGSAVTPEIEYMHFDDDEYFVVNSQGASGSAAYPISYRFDSSVSTTGITSYRFNLQSRAPFYGVQQVIEFYNFSQTRFVERSRVFLPPNEDATIEANIQSNLSQYVQTGAIKKIRARISYRSLAIDPVLLTMKVDRGTWFIGRP